MTAYALGGEKAMSKIINVNPDNVEVVNTTTETTIYTFDIYEYLKFKGMEDLMLTEFPGFKLIVWSIINENNAGTPVYTFKTYINNVQTNAVTMSGMGGYPYCRYDSVNYIFPGLNKIQGAGEIYVEKDAASTTHSMIRSECGMSSNTFRDELSVKATIQMSAASSNIGLTKGLASLELF